MGDLLSLALQLAEVATQVPESPGLVISTVRADDDTSLWCVDCDPVSRVVLVELIESNGRDVQFTGRGPTLDAAARELLRAMLAEVDRRATHPAVEAARSEVSRG